MLKNLDTGQLVPLKEVEEELSKNALDPITFNILRRAESEPRNSQGTEGTESEPEHEADQEQQEDSVTNVIDRAKQFLSHSKPFSPIA